MIVYDSRKWVWFFISLIKIFRKSYNLRQLTRFMFYTFIYTSVVTYLCIKYLKGSYYVDELFLSLIGVILSLFLVYRLNTGYDRWWQGRQAWGKLTNASRAMALHLNTLIPTEDAKKRRFFCRHISNFSTGLVWHLRDLIDNAEYILAKNEDKSDITSAQHQPNRIASLLFIETESLYKSGDINEFDKQQIKSLLNEFVEVTGICERIKKTPIPFSHSTFIKIFILIYILILPFGLINSFEYLTIPAVMVMVFAMLGIEVISEEIENPFGLDANDLPTGQISATIRRNVYEIMNIEIKEQFKVPEKVLNEADILH